MVENGVKKPSGRPSKDKTRRTYTIDRKIAEFIDGLPDGDRSEFVNAAMRAEIARRRTCCMCEEQAAVECKIGKCAPSKWYCSYHYAETHIPE